MLGHVGRHFGDTFWSGRGHFFVIFGMSWDVSGSGLGMFLDRFGMVLKKCPTRLKNQSFQICPGVFFLSRGAQNNCF